ncbi:MAG: ABC transporter substrate-binding protein [Firmicutes bacterium]|mgnify:CR=1 FL=1|nr:ABC transporter substrate-binding protein [Bacillota bacterium]
MSKKAWFVLSLAVVIVAVLLGTSASAQKLEVVRLTEVVRSVFYAPHYVALAKGFFEEEGLQVELGTAWGADKGAAAVISGAVDIGFFGPEATVYIYQQGAEDHLIGFAQLTARDGSFFVTRDVEEDFQWDNVRGKTIVGARIGGVPQMALEWVLKKHGIRPFEDVKIITGLAFEAAVGAFEAGLGDYIAQFEPAMSEIEARGRGKIVASIGAEAGPLTYTVYHARKSNFEQNPEMFLRFTRAFHQGQLWVYSHSAEEVAEVIAPFFPLIDLDILADSMRLYQSIDAWPPTPVISEGHFLHLQEVMIEAGELEEMVPFSLLMDTAIAQTVVDELQQ